MQVCIFVYIVVVCEVIYKACGYLVMCEVFYMYLCVLKQMLRLAYAIVRRGLSLVTHISYLLAATAKTVSTNESLSKLLYSFRHYNTYRFIYRNKYSRVRGKPTENIAIIKTHKYIYIQMYKALQHVIKLLVSLNI